MDPEQYRLIGVAIAMGDHVRVGTEDNPSIEEKQVTTEELVYWVTDIAKAIGRRIATIEESAKIIGINR
jgi:uncharacterized protein (DUF849 family)